MGQDTGRTDQLGNPGQTDRIGITDLGDGGPAVDTDRGSRRSPRRRNPFFAAAWVLAILMIAVGALWPLLLTGPGPRYADYLPENAMSQFSMYTMNTMMQAGPTLLVAGFVAAVALLIVHGIQRRGPA